MSERERDWLSVSTPHRRYSTVRKKTPYGEKLYERDDPADPVAVLEDFLEGRVTGARRVREAIRCILLSDWDAQGYGRLLISTLFDERRRPKGSTWGPVWRAIFTRTSTGHANPWRDMRIASDVHARFRRSGSYRTAIAEVAELLGPKGRDPRTVERIYAKYKNSFRPLPTPDTPSDVTTSDRRADAVKLRK
jgi:hypothetical protein